MPGPSIGDRSWPVTIEQRSATDLIDSSGAPSDEGWTTLSRVTHMKRINATGEERFQSMQESTPVRTVWEMPYRSDMDPDRVADFTKLRRLKFYSRIYDITFGQVIGHNEAISLDTLARQG